MNDDKEAHYKRTIDELISLINCGQSVTYEVVNHNLFVVKAVSLERYDQVVHERNELDVSLQEANRNIDRLLKTLRKYEALKARKIPSTRKQRPQNTAPTLQEYFAEYESTAVERDS